MAAPRLTKSGKYELCLHHELLPKGRKFFTFDGEQEAIDYAAQWGALVAAGLPPPLELLAPAPRPKILLSVISAWSETGRPSVTDEVLLAHLRVEVGSVAIADVTYAWAEGWVERMKFKQNLAPSTIRQRVGALARALDHFYRKTLTGNPLRLLPRGYSQYTGQDAKRALALGKEAKTDVARDRRLKPGEHDAILAALGGARRHDRERALLLEHREALQLLYALILRTGVRLKEALGLTVGQVDLDRRTIRVRQSKQWRGKLVWRDVPMRVELVEPLDRAIRDRLPQARVFPFWNEAEDATRASNRVSKMFARLFEYAGCVGLVEHDLRHEATCQWYELRGKGGHWVFREAEIDKIMGWAPGSKMSARYTSFRAEDLSSRLPS